MVVDAEPEPVISESLNRGGAGLHQIAENATDKRAKLERMAAASAAAQHSLFFVQKVDNELLVTCGCVIALLNLLDTLDF